MRKCQVQGFFPTKRACPTPDVDYYETALSFTEGPGFFYLPHSFAVVGWWCHFLRSRNDLIPFRPLHHLLEPDCWNKFNSRLESRSSTFLSRVIKRRHVLVHFFLFFLITCTMQVSQPTRWWYIGHIHWKGRKGRKNKWQFLIKLLLLLLARNGNHSRQRQCDGREWRHFPYCRYAARW